MELVHKGKHYEDNLTGSDREILQTYLQATKVEIITPNEQKAAQNQKRKGAYFNYLNITGLDLSRYQIGNVGEEKAHLDLIIQQFNNLDQILCTYSMWKRKTIRHDKQISIIEQIRMVLQKFNCMIWIIKKQIYSLQYKQDCLNKVFFI
ncbi:Hypothetical_protein [Hexamita inflata]|uniref:Hypothetical_protein n=1 Tax=Hexamita inflata TaxID=28002 RepID=A0AA86N664_9EUKA|nr:Hypothetical protein HINF_LOCUS1160 [Hexamita inflata]